MKKDETLFDKAKQNYYVAKSLMNTLGDDEVYLNYIGYHLQQSVEFVIKFVLELNGSNYPKTHDIEQLIMLANSEDINLDLTDYIQEHSEMFTLWEAKTRYILNYRLEKNKINRAMQEVNNYLNIIENEYVMDNSMQQNDMVL